VATQRLGLCRFGLPLCPVPLPAKLRDFVLARLSDSLPMSPLAHHARPHRLPTRHEDLRHPPGHLEPPDRSSDTTRAGRQRHCGFSLRSASLCPAAKPQRLWLCRWRSDRAPMSPLRAVVSRGHIALRNCNHRSAFALEQLYAGRAKPELVKAGRID